MSIAVLPSHTDGISEHAKSAVTASFALHLRVPGWCAKPEFVINGESIPKKVNGNGYQVIDRAWKTGDQIEITLPMELQMDASKTIQTGGAGNNHNLNRNNYVKGGLPYVTVSLGEEVAAYESSGRAPPICIAPPSPLPCLASCLLDTLSWIHVCLQRIPNRILAGHLVVSIHRTPPIRAATGENRL